MQKMSASKSDMKSAPSNKKSSTFSREDRKNQIVESCADFDTRRMILSDPQTCTVANSPITYYRVNISTQNKDGTMGDLLIPTAAECFSFGVSEAKSFETNKATGYVLPICLYSKTGATDEEKQWVEGFNRIVDHCKKYLVENRTKIPGRRDLVISDLRNLNPLYWKRDKETQEPVPGVGPVLYAKLIMSKPKPGAPGSHASGDAKQNVIKSMFFRANSKPKESIPLPELLEKKFIYTRALIKIESIYIGSGSNGRFAFQVKLYEAHVRYSDKNLMVPLLAGGGGDEEDDDDGEPTSLMGGSGGDYQQPNKSSVDTKAGGSLPNSDDEDNVAPSKTSSSSSSQQAVTTPPSLLTTTATAPVTPAKLAPPRRPRAVSAKKEMS